MTRYLLLLSIAALAFSAVDLTAQATIPQIATDSKGACTTYAPNGGIHAKGSAASSSHSSKPNLDAITIPKLVYAPGPDFPPSVLKEKIFGTVLIALLVDTNGNAKEVHVYKSIGPAFDKAIISAVQRYRFRPALQHGQPVQVKLCIGITHY